MKIYDFPLAPNPRKLRTYLGEKGLEIPFENVNLVHGEQNEPAFLAMNPRGGVPVLELDDGSYLCESLAIIEYLEELHPEPCMIGETPLERARVRSLERYAEFSVLAPTARIVHNTRKLLPSSNPIPAVAEKARPQRASALARLDEEIGASPFVAGDRPTIADCTLFAAIKFGEAVELAIDPALSNLTRWHEDFSKRPSAQLS